MFWQKFKISVFLAFTPKDRKPGEIEKPGNYLLKKLHFSS